MIQYYLDLQRQVKIISEQNLAYGQIQKIYSTSFFISFSIRTQGKTWHLYLGRGAGQEGLWLHDKAPLSVLRRKDTFLEYLRRHISSCSFIDLALDQYDRIVKLSYQKYGQIQSMLFFWKARKLYFIHHYQDLPETPFKLLLSWHGKAITPSTDLPTDLFELFNEIGRRNDFKHDQYSSSNSSIAELLEDELKAADLKELSSSPNFLQRKITNIEGDLKRTKQWSDMQQILDQHNSLDCYELKVGDHKIKFEGDLNPYERRNLLFEKIKKLKRGEGILEQRLQDAKEKLVGNGNESKVSSSLAMTRPVWGKKDKKDEKLPLGHEREDYKLFKFNIFTIGVGLSASGNDQLRNKWASKEDTWVHLEGLKSSHAVIKYHAAEALSAESLNLAASIVAYFSHFAADWIPIIYTQVKNLKGVTGSAGMVIYKKEKHLRCPMVEASTWLKE